MPASLVSSTLAVAAIAAGALVSNAGLASAAPAGCQIIGTAPIGFNVDSTRVTIYTDKYPAVFATFQGHRTADGFQYLQPSNEPELFDFVSCQTTIPEGYGKGSSLVQSGYIASRKAPGYCLTATSLTGNDERIVSKPCNFIDGAPSKHSSFQFSLNSFFNYHVIDFLGKATPGPAPSGTDTYGFPFGKSGSGYRYTIQGNPGEADSFLRLSYDPQSPNPGTVADLAFNKAWTGNIDAQPQ
ncbi:uncharacterized protein PFL1_02171 [Pseudozyma flocculosa PF-1]|uniref:Uncharacterized protein n=1 Tax=Pseudozyma flocculosa TaxID=84751 RepID=A0A5C3FAC9_9BASI|nr:uncharacterized protein PFL1_02171 [Pseudozyma flocculosa PF-1]EPQ30054.1 hypothetical protein PFL1_02171 [Pseudozyma flocculosa PF-1]SPO41394.1 uncharacterized protein PSFLO_06876 [Pseudozyma flocculosa]